MKTKLVVAAVLALGFGQSAFAQVTINQSKALTGNITTGDTAGFPVTISKSGSYKLTGNLTVTDPNVGAINIVADDVTLDLNGFTISGPNTCTWGATVTCTYMTPTAVGVQGYLARNAVVKNGSVRGFSSGGVNLGHSAMIENVSASHNWAVGLAASDGGIVRGVRAFLNGSDGVRVYNGSIYDSMARNNGGHGFYTNYSLLSGSQAVANKGSGLSSFLSAAGFRESVFNFNGLPNEGISMGNNLCDKVSC